MFQKSSGLRCTNDFLELFCEKNSDGTKKLRFKGNELEQRFGERLMFPDMENLCYFINGHPQINEIDLSYNPIEDEGWRILCTTILKYPNKLEHLNVSSCDITEDGMKHFYFAALENNMILKTLRVCGNKISPQGGYFTALAIPYIPNLEYLDLGDTDQTADSVDCIFLQVYPSNIKIINISRVIPRSVLLQVDNSFLGESLCELFRVNKQLSEVHVQKCGLEAGDVENLILGLMENTTLRYLDLGYNHICCVGAELLADWLKGRPQIIGLNIAGNMIKDHGAVALSFGLPFSKLRVLDLSDNRIGKNGMIAILESIKKSYPLRYFHIWGNALSHEVNKILERMMRSKVFQQENIDVKLYCVDGVWCAARFPIDHYKHRYYGVMDYGCAVELKIKRNKIGSTEDKPRALVDFQHIDRYPAVEKQSTE